MEAEYTKFDKQVDEWVLDLICAGTEAFGDLLMRLPGVYPTDALASVSRLATHRKIDGSVLAKANLYVSQACNEPKSRDALSILPVPHPLDYAWRFSRVAVGRLMAYCQSLRPSPQTIILLGAPSVLSYASDLSWRDKLVLIDSDPTTTAALMRQKLGHIVLCTDLTREEVPLIKESIVIADPPWYPEHMHLFTWIASRLCHVGGHVLLSYPGRGTRPGIAQEWAHTVDWASQNGLSLVDLLEGELPYVSPPFERNALVASGISCIPREWRHGTLAVFKCERGTLMLRPEGGPPREAWNETTIGDVRIRVRHDVQNHGVDPSLVSITPGDILPTVSRRDIRRRNADVWTSGNRVFACQSCGLLTIIMRAVATGVSPCDAVENSLRHKVTGKERSLVEKASQQVADVTTLELMDLQRFS